MSDTTDLATVWQTPGSAPWLGLSARMLDFLHMAAGRTDLIAVVNPQPRHSAAPACFLPDRAEIHFNGEKIFTPFETDPDCIDPTDPADRALWPHLMGLATHEAAHAAHPLSIPVGTPADVAKWATCLDEPRIETRMATEKPALRVWLRAAAGWYFGKDGYKIDGTAVSTAAQAVVLAVGRQRGGVLDLHEVAPLIEQAQGVFGADYEALIAAVDLALGAEDGDTASMIAAAEVIAKLVKDAQEDADDGPDGQGGGQSESADDQGREGGQGQPDDGQGSGEAGQPDDGQGGNEAAHQLPCGSWTTGALPEGEDPTEQDDTYLPQPGEGTLRAIAQEVGRQIAQHVADQVAPKMMRATEDRRTKDIESNRAAESAKAVFGGTQPATIVVRSRVPDADLLDQTRRLTGALRRASLRGSQRVRVASPTPPGRMRTAELVRREGQIARGVRVTAMPWQHVHRRETPAPTIRVGISGDVSDSQTDAQQRTADLTFALAQAVRAVNGEVAAVAWNVNAAPILHPGSTPRHVVEARCAGGSTGCPLSLRALDGALQLTSRTDGLRVLVVVTDAALPNYQAARQEVARQARTGVHVLWVTPYPDPDIGPAAKNVVLDPLSVDYGAVIGAALAGMLERA